MGRGRLTPLAVAVLSLLEERAMHPYEMYQLFLQRTTDRLVKIRPGSLYHTVDRLERAGLVRAVGTDREGNRPERTSYDVTEEGQLALTERVAEMISAPVNEYPEFPFAIAEMDGLPLRTVLDLLRRRVQRLRSEIDFLAMGEEKLLAKRLEPRHWLDVGYLQAMYRAEAEWIEGLLDRLASGEIEWSDIAEQTARPRPETKEDPQ